MVSFFGDYDITETVNIPFNTFSSDDPSASVTITNLVAGDIEIHKDGSTGKRSSDAGVTVSINFDTVTGNHMAHIDLSDNTHVGYYSVGARYQVRIEGTTVDGATINAWIGAFSVGCTLRPATDGRTLVVDAAGLADANVVKVGPTGSGTAQTANNMSGDVNDILTDTDVIDDATSGLVKIAQDVAAILVDTDVIDDGTSGLVKIASDVAATLVDTAVIGALGAGLTDLGGMSTAMKAEVNVEAKDVIAIDTRAEPAQGTPGATIAMAAKIDWLYKIWRNKKDQDGSTTQYYNDDASTVDHKRTTSEAAGTVTDAEVVTGP